MVTPDQVRDFALGLPESGEHPHFERTAFTVRKKIFATLSAQDGTLNLRLTPDHVATMTQVDSAAFEKVQWGKTENWLRVLLGRADRADVEDLLIDAWYERMRSRESVKKELLERMRPEDRAPFDQLEDPWPKVEKLAWEC